MDRRTTLKEINTHYDINDLLDIHELMDLEDESNKRAEMISRSKYK